MQLWPATIASPPSTRRMPMVCLIIVWLPAEDKVYSWGKAHADPHVRMSRDCVRFFLCRYAGGDTISGIWVFMWSYSTREIVSYEHQSAFTGYDGLDLWVGSSR